MILTETNLLFPLSEVKPLDGIMKYRDFCVAATKKALLKGSTIRTQSSVGDRPLIDWGTVDGLTYSQCPDTGSLFLKEVGSRESWQNLLKEVAEERDSQKGFHQNVAGTRASNVYIPKLEWIESVLHFQGLKSIDGIEIKTQPSKFSSLLKTSRVFRSVKTVGEMEFLPEANSKDKNCFNTAILLESLDRVPDPKSLIDKIFKSLKKNGLLFLTALASSGFDMKVLGPNNLYLCPPDRTNCFSLLGLKKLVTDAGFTLVEVSTPGVLDIEVVEGHLRKFPNFAISDFEKSILNEGEETRRNFQSFLQKSGLSSFVRIVGRKN